MGSQLQFLQHQEIWGYGQGFLQHLIAIVNILQCLMMIQFLVEDGLRIVYYVWHKKKGCTAQWDIDFLIRVMVRAVKDLDGSMEIMKLSKLILLVMLGFIKKNG